MSTVLDSVGPIFSYHGRTYGPTLKGSANRLARTSNGDVVLDADSKLYRIRNWNLGHKIIFTGFVETITDLKYERRTGVVTHKPSGRDLLQLESWLNPISVIESFQILEC